MPRRSTPKRNSEPAASYCNRALFAALVMVTLPITHVVGAKPASVIVCQEPHKCSDAAPSSPKAESHRTVVLPPRVEWPNGITFDRQGRLLVGSITAPIIARLEAGAWTVQDISAPGIFSVTSLTLDPERDIIWGTSPAFLEEDSSEKHGLYALDAQGLELIRYLRLPDNGFANDTEIAPDGRLLVTDSVNGRVLAYDWRSDAFEILVEDDRLLPLRSVGAAGVTRDSNGRIYVSNYESGELLLLEDDSLKGIELPFPLKNPDGLAFTDDGALLIAEGAVASGNGRLLRIPDPAVRGERTIEVLQEGLESPVNLAIGNDQTVYVTESRIRRRVGPHPKHDEPTDFRVVLVRHSLSE